MNGNEKTKDRTRWPWFAQLLLALAVLLTAVILLIWIPMRTAPSLVGGTPGGATQDFSMMMVVFVGLTTMTISGIFLFMTFRIDHGTKNLASDIAREIAISEARKTAKEETGKVVGSKFTELWGDKFIEDLQNEKDEMKRMI